MKKLLVLPLVLLAAFCSTAPKAVLPPPGSHGAITIEIVPNPIVAGAVPGADKNDLYEFPFEVVIREGGGHAVTVRRVSADVTALGGAIHVGNEAYDAPKIAALGFSTSIPAHGELRYRFTPRRAIPDTRFFAGVKADLHVDAVDDTGTSVTANTVITVTLK